MTPERAIRITIVLGMLAVACLGCALLTGCAPVDFLAACARRSAGCQ